MMNSIKWFNIKIIEGKMKSTNNHYAVWPELQPIDECIDTQSTVHMWSQIVGKIRLELSPVVSHAWGTALYVSPKGLITSSIPYNGSSVNIEFDFVNHKLGI